MMAEDLKFFVVHTTDPASIDSLKECLNAHGDYRRYYDGWESTLGKDPEDPNKRVPIATRLYYYNIPKLTLTQMVRHLQVVRQTRPIAGFRVKIGNMEELKTPRAPTGTPEVYAVVASTG